MRPYQRFTLDADFSPLKPLILEALMSKKHPGFKGAVASVERKQNVSKESADKIIGAGKARASAEAREKNPRLNKTGGKKGGY